MRRGFLLFSCITILLFLSVSTKVSACTLWAAAGDRLADGGTMIHKNRDWNPDHQQDLRLVIPKNGLRYLSLYITGNEWVGTKAGVNSDGLVIVTASASAYYESVDKTLKTLEANEWKCGPEFIIMADCFFAKIRRNNGEITSEAIIINT